MADSGLYNYSTVQCGHVGRPSKTRRNWSAQEREESTEETKGSFSWEVIPEKELLGWARGWVKDAVDRGYAMFG